MKRFKTTEEVKIPDRLVDQVIGQDKAVDIIKKAAKQHRNVMLIGEPGCLIGDERVFLGNGAILKIQDFGSRHLEDINAAVLVGSGNKTASAKVYHAYEKQPTIEVITESGKSIKGTHNHPILVVNNKEEPAGSAGLGVWKRLDEIHEGDRVVVVSGVRCTIRKYVKTGFSTVKRNAFGPKFRGKLPLKVTPSLGAFFGYMIGDGWVDANRERLGFVVSDDEKDILPELLSFVHDNFAVCPPTNVRRRTDKNRKMTMHYVDISNKDIYHNLKFLGEKRVPDLILQSGNEVASAFLKWLFTADGTVYNGGRGRRGIGLKAKNIELLRDVQTMLLRFGIESRIIGFLQASANNAPQLAIRSGHNIIKFNEKIGFACNKKVRIADELARDAHAFARRLKQRSERVVRVIEGDPEDVFDIEVPKWHRFIANGIVSHNTGKTLIAQAIAELLPVTDLEDVLVYRNPNDENHPLIKSLKTYPKVEAGKPLGDGQGRTLVQREKMKNRMDVGKGKSSWIPLAMMIIVAILVIVTFTNFVTGYQTVMIGALILGIMIFGSVLMLVGGFRRSGMMPGTFESSEPKLIVDNTGMEHAPFFDGTGARAGHLFGDVKHDPLQSGGLGTPAHLRVESGLIHKANNGVLFIDEIADIEPRSQQELLTAKQEKKYSITGQSEMSSGALVRTEPVPCDFLLVAAGNLQDISKMHPALRSRIRGYGYEVYMESSMPDTEANREKLVRFITQEVKKDGKIPPFDFDACMEIIDEAKRRSGRHDKLTLILRELGGVVRAAGDMASEKKKKVVTRDDVRDALKVTTPIEAQYVEQSLEYRKDYKIFKTSGFAIGRVNGLAIVGSSYLSAGMVLPIVAEVTQASSRTEGKLIPTGKLGKIAREAVKNISAVIKRHMKRDMAKYDIHVQFLQTYEGVEGDSASISVAVAVMSALEGIPVSQDIAMTGSLSVRGDVLPVGGITNKVRAAIEAGMKQVIVPESNAKDIYINKKELGRIKVIPVKNIAEVLHFALKKSERRDEMVEKLRKYITSDFRERNPLALEEIEAGE